jgi:hypothetical protein
MESRSALIGMAMFGAPARESLDGCNYPTLAGPPAIVLAALPSKAFRGDWQPVLADPASNT